MKKTVLFFSCEPGGAEVLIPVVRLLTQTGSCRVVVLAYGLGLQRFRKNGITCIETQPIGRNDPHPFRCYAPDFVITSAASLPERDMSERHLWLNARKFGVKSIAFLDQWQNYALRFSGPVTGERLVHLPDFISCMNELGRAEMVAEGFSEHMLLPLGHPYLSGILTAYDMIKREMAGRSPESWGTPEPGNTLLFVSEPILEHFGNSRGYNQYRVLELLLGNVLAYRKNAQVIIKLHPKDDVSNYRLTACRFKHLNIRFVQNELSSLECLTLAERIFGMSSIMLIEAFILGKAVVSIQPSLTINDPFVLTRHNLVPRISDYSAFDPFAFLAGAPEKLEVSFDEDRFLRFLAEQM